MQPPYPASNVVLFPTHCEILLTSTPEQTLVTGFVAASRDGDGDVGLEGEGVAIAPVVDVGEDSPGHHGSSVVVSQ